MVNTITTTHMRGMLLTRESLNQMLGLGLRGEAPKAIAIRVGSTVDAPRTSMVQVDNQ